MNLKRTSFVIAVCALAGALAGIAGSAAAPSKSSKATAAAKDRKQARMARRAFRRGFRLHGGPGFPGGPVHGEAVVPQRDGSGFFTVTTDSGTLNSVDGNTLHIKEAVDNNVYKDDAAVTVGDNVKVIRNHQDAKLSDLKAGDHVRVITGAPKGDIVIAEDDAFQAQERKEHGFREGHEGFGPPPGPPPAGDGAAAPGSYPGAPPAPGSNS